MTSPEKPSLTLQAGEVPFLRAFPTPCPPWSLSPADVAGSPGAGATAVIPVVSLAYSLISSLRL